MAVRSDSGTTRTGTESGNAAMLRTFTRAGGPAAARPSRPRGARFQSGLTITSLILWLAGIGLIAVVAMKVSPTVSEYFAVKKAVEYARTAGKTPLEIRAAFDRQANVGYIESITGKDLDVVKNGESFDVSFAYQKKIPLVGPASLLMEYQGTTAIARAPAKAMP
jgi:hypothetical protein